MTNPRHKTGFIKVPNELLDALCKIRIAGQSRQVLDAIIRKTLGYNKPIDWIALSQFEKMTGLSKPHVIRAIDKLLIMNLIYKEKRGSIVLYSLNQDYNTWIPLPKKVTVPKKAINVANKGNPSLPIKVPTKDNTTTDNITKDKEGALSNKKEKVGKGKIYSEVIGYLNQHLKYKFSSNPNSRRGHFKLLPAYINLITNLVACGYTQVDFKHVINVKIEEWWDDPKMSQHLAPATLFKPDNFEKYLAQTIEDVKKSKQGGKNGKCRRTGSFGKKSGPREE